MAASRLIGRDAELNLLTEFVADLVTGSGRATLIEGEPGIGKSSLAHAVKIMAVQRGYQVYWATCDELSQALPLRPILDALQQEKAPDGKRLATIGRLLRGECGNIIDPTPVATEQMFALVSDLCKAAPAVFVIDDLQWADLATISVWERLARTVGRLPLLLIGVSRPLPEREELLAIRRGLGPKSVVRLDRLTDAAVTDLVADLSNARPGLSLLEISASAAGNPLYLTELVAALTRANRIVTSDTGVAEVTSGPAPESLHGSIIDRLDFLTRDVRKVLDAAALLGVDFMVADLAVVRHCRVADLVTPIGEARTAGVLVENGEKLSFRHPLIHAALYDGIPIPVRSAWHRDVARALAQAGVPVHRVARQLLQAFAPPHSSTLDEPLLDWLADAAPALVAQNPGMAIDLLRAGCRRSPPATTRGAWLVCRLAEALHRSGNNSEAERIARHALSVATDPDTLVDLHWTVAQCRAFAGRADDSLDTIGEAIALPTISQRQRARLMVLAARAHRDLGQVSMAGQIAVNALATAEEAGDAWARGWSLHVLIIVAMMRGDVAAALPLFDRALDAVGDDPALIDLGLLLQINQSVALGELDRYGEAVDAATQVRQLADHVGSMVRLAQARCALGQLLFEAGQWSAAQDEVEALEDDVKDPGTTCCDRGIAALIAFHRGDAATAREHLSLAAESAEQIGTRLVSSLAIAHGLDHEVAGEPEKALSTLVSCLAGHTEELDEVEDLLPEVARLAAILDSIDMLKDVAARAVDLAQRSRVPHRLGTVAFCRGLLTGSTSLVLLAAEKYGAAGRPLLQVKALEAAAGMLADVGDRGAARSAFVRADDLYQGLGATWDLARLRAAFRRWGIRRGPRAAHRRVRTGWGSLTASEVRVAELVADGLSNRQIAERLVLSTRTVESHVSHILAKLGVRSRVDIVRGMGATR